MQTRTIVRLQAATRRYLRQCDLRQRCTQTAWLPILLACAFLGLFRSANVLAEDAAATPQSVEAAEQSTSTNQVVGVLYLKNGDYLPGRLSISDSPGRLAWVTPMFRDPIEFDLSGLKYISYPLAATDDEGDSSANGARFQMVRGESLRGELVELDSEFLTLQGERHGRVTVSRSLLTEIDGVSENAAVLFDGAASLAKWATLAFTNHGKTPWSVAGRSLETQSAGANLYASCTDAPRVLCEVELSGRETPEFQIVLGASNAVNELKQSFSIETWGRELVLHRQDGDRLQAVRLSVPPLPRSDWNVQFEVYLDYDKRQITVYSGGMRVGEVSMPTSETLPGFGIAIRNRGTHLSVDEARVRRWTGPPRSSDQLRDQVVTKDGKTIVGSLTTMNAESRELTIELEDDGGDTTEEPTEVAKSETIRADAIDRIRFRGVGATGSPVNVDANTEAPAQVHITYDDGSLLRGRYLKVAMDGIYLQTRISKEPIRMGWDGMTAVRFTTESPSDELWSGKFGLVATDKGQLHGRIVKADSGSEMYWEPIYSQNAVPFDTRISTQVRFEPSSNAIGIETINSWLALTNGDTIPCEVESIDSDFVYVKFADGQQSQVPREHFKALRDLRTENWIYPGLKRGDRWLLNHDRSDAWALRDDGTLDLFDLVMFGKRLALPDRCRISFDIQFRTNVLFTMGYGADTAENAVHSFAANAANRRRLQELAQQPPDNLVDLHLILNGRNLNARFVSRVGGPVGAVQFARVNARASQVDPAGIVLDERMVAHIEWTINRHTREFSVTANGQELRRWRTRAPLDGEFLHFGIQNRMKAQRLMNSSATAADNVPMVTLYNLRVSRWPGEMQEPQRDRFLTRRIGTSKQAVTHVLRASNGDSLRGRLVRLVDDAVQFEARRDTFTIPREKVVEVISLAELSPQKAPQDTIRVHLWDGGTVSFRAISADDKFLRGTSSLVGNVSLPWSAVASINYHGAADLANPFAEWVAIEPASLPDAAEPPAATSDWMNKPAPNLVFSMLDGEQVALAELKGKPVVLDFWATWCGPCLAAMPQMIELADQLEGKIHFVAVNQQESAEEVRAFIDARLWELPVSLDVDGALGRMMEVNAIPYTIVIDPEGIVRHVHLGAAPDLGRQLTEVLSEWLE